MRYAGASRRTTSGKSNAWRSRIFQAEAPWVLLQDFHAKIFAQNLTAIFVRLAQWLADARYQHRRHGYRDQLRQCAVQDEEQPGQAFLGNFATGPLMAVIAAYGRCGSSCAPRTQVPERHEKSPSPRIPDAVSKNTVRLKLMTLCQSPHRAFPFHHLPAYFRRSLSKTCISRRSRRRLDRGGDQRLAGPANQGQPQGCALRGGHNNDYKPGLFTE